VAERPIPFSGPMVRGILAGTKTQTRRLLREALPADGSPYWCDLLDEWRWMDEGGANGGLLRCPYGVPGDRLWVREAICRSGGYLQYEADTKTSRHLWPADWKRDARIGMFMPRWASRLTLEVTDVRVQRLQDISEEDATAEGVIFDADEGAHRVDGVALPRADHPNHATIGWVSARRAFEHLWDSINAKRAPWDSNPWVWAVAFKRL
jgi:hypothetical protein